MSYSNEDPDKVIEAGEYIAGINGTKNLIKNIIIHTKKFVGTIPITILILLIALSTTHTKITVTSGSMIPTIYTNETLLVRKTKDIKRGDVVMFYSEENRDYYLKRLIGMPGDIVDIREGTVYINSVFYKEDYLGSNNDFSGTFFVPEDCYFFLGDNRADSFDARYWEQPYIADSFVTGKVILRLAPLYGKIV